ncbi:MAG: DUF5602 domain-containing protein [Saprospiraceae bacterium]|nr:DUF5602 domain-containing protein [Saprospiraceae bacterium]
MKIKFETIRFPFLLLAFAMLLHACDKRDPWAGSFVGEEKTFGFGKARTYVINDDDGKPLEIGVVIDEAAFNNFNSMSGDHEVTLNFPQEAGNTPFLHQFMGFAAHGHEPAGIYDVPHFDLHFYTMPSDEREAITPFDTIKGNFTPSPDYFPAGYGPTGLVPQMGNHWIDFTSPEFAGQSFTETFIWGSYDGKVTFLEPMITHDFITDTHDFEEELKQPAKYDQPGKYYPTKHGFAHDHDKKEYRIYLKSFVQR